MKKLLLLAAAALTIVACKKDNGGDPTPPPAPGPTPQTQTPTVTADQSSVPTTVNFKYPKSFTKITTVGGRITATNTVTYTVENSLLKKVAVNIDDSESNHRENFAYTLAYDSKNYLTSIEGRGEQPQKFSYNSKGQLTTIVRGTLTRTFVYNTENKITSSTYKDPHEDKSYTYDYSVANQIKIVQKDADPNYKDRHYIYVLDAKGNPVSTKVLEVPSSIESEYTLEYDDKPNYQSKGVFKFFKDEYLNGYADEYKFVSSPNNLKKETVVKGYDPNRTYTYTYDADGNVTQRVCTYEKQVGANMKTVVETTIYNY